MSEPTRVWGVLLTDQGLQDLKDALKVYLREGPIGQYIYCSHVDMGQNYFHMLGANTNPDGSRLEAELYIPHHYVKLIIAAKEERQIGFIAHAGE